MNICVIGKGGREQALIGALKNSPTPHQIYCFPGSDAIHHLDGIKPVEAESLTDLINWMSAHHIDLCLPGEESYLVQEEGLANLCAQQGIPCWGPNKQAAQLEASKEFAKDFLLKHKIPTGQAIVCDTLQEAHDAINGAYPTVLKFDGLAAGKGVAVCTDEESAHQFLEDVFVQKKFGDGRLLVEEHLTGPEISIFAAVSRNQYQVFTPARDYKRIGEGDTGANTGGMGAVASRHLIDSTLMKTIEEQIIQPTVTGMEADGLDYIGFLYFGLMLTPSGPQVIEYNCRFGDPECQAVMPLMEGDFAQFCYDGAQGNLRPELLHFSEDWSVGVILASAGYPEGSRSGDKIHGLDELEGVRLYHAGTQQTEHGWETNGGRVLAVVATEESREQAVYKAHLEASKISFSGSQRRNDIGRLHFS